MTSKRQKSLLGLIIIALPLILVDEVRAQSPLGDDLVVAAFPPNVWAEWAPQPVCDDAGVCGLFWADTHNSPEASTVDIIAALLSPEGQLVTPPRILATGQFPSGPITVGLQRSFAIFWDRVFPDGHISPVLQYFDEMLDPQSEAITLPFTESTSLTDPNLYNGFSTILRTSSGFVLYGSTSTNGSSLAWDAFVYFIDRAGHVIRPRVKVNQGSGTYSNTNSLPSLALQPNGDLVAAYWRGKPGASNIYMRRLSSTGKVLGSERFVNSKSKESNGLPVVAVGPDGSMIVVWQRAPAPGKPSDIMARLFSAQGRPLGAPFLINDTHLLDQRRPVVIADVRGNYFIAWQSFDPSSPGYQWDIHGRLFRHDGKPLSDEIRLNQDQQLDQTLPQLTFAPNGTVVAGWQSSSPHQISTEAAVPVIRLFASDW